MQREMKGGIFCAVLAAVLYAVNALFSKQLLHSLPPTLMAGFLYLGAGAGMALIALIRRIRKTAGRESKLTRAELPYTVAMIVLDIAAPVCLMFGLRSTPAASAALLNNFEIVATALIAWVVFRERIRVRLWLGILCVTAACALLSLENLQGMHFSKGSLLVLLAAVCWGLENNCTRKLSDKDPMEIVLLKGLFSGAGSLITGLCIGERVALWSDVPAALALGFVAYGLSIFFYVYAQRKLGAARTSTFYALAPFVSVFLSLALFREKPGYAFPAALALMALGTWLSACEK